MNINLGNTVLPEHADLCSRCGFTVTDSRHTRVRYASISFIYAYGRTVKFIIMAKLCVVGGCSNQPNPSSGVSLHKFPTSPATCRLWVKAVKTTRAKWNHPTRWTYICSAHFKSEDFEPAYNLKLAMGLAARARRLCPNAVPTVFVRPRLNNIATPTSHARAKSKTEGSRICKRQYKQVWSLVIFVQSKLQNTDKFAVYVCSIIWLQQINLVWYIVKLGFCGMHKCGKGIFNHYMSHNTR